MDAPHEEARLRAAWEALADRDRRGDELVRRRVAELEERLARLEIAEQEVEARASSLDGQEQAAAESRRALEDREAELARREHVVAEREQRTVALADAERAAGARELELRELSATLDERAELVVMTETALNQREERL